MGFDISSLLNNFLSNSQGGPQSSVSQKLSATGDILNDKNPDFSAILNRYAGQPQQYQRTITDPATQPSPIAQGAQQVSANLGAQAGLSPLTTPYTPIQNFANQFAGQYRIPQFNQRGPGGYY